MDNETVLSPPPPSPSVYVPFDSKRTNRQRTMSVGDPVESSPVQEGVFISEAELLALRQWADARETAASELTEAAAARDEEVKMLRMRLVRSQTALRAAFGSAVGADDQQEATLALASSTQRVKASAQRRREAQMLLRELRAMKQGRACVA